MSSPATSEWIDVSSRTGRWWVRWLASCRSPARWGCPRVGGDLLGQPFRGRSNDRQPAGAPPDRCATALREPPKGGLVKARSGGDRIGKLGAKTVRTPPGPELLLPVGSRSCGPAEAHDKLQRRAAEGGPGVAPTRKVGGGMDGDGQRTTTSTGLLACSPVSESVSYVGGRRAPNGSGERRNEDGQPSPRGEIEQASALGGASVDAVAYPPPPQFGSAMPNFAPIQRSRPPFARAGDCAMSSRPGGPNCNPTGGQKRFSRGKCKRVIAPDGLGGGWGEGGGRGIEQGMSLGAGLLC
jgi:hypothetical protein